jgi:phenylacetate 2-hydroxylase
MASPIVLGVAGLVIFLIARYLNSSDIPRIKNLPEIPGVPLFGNLLQLGTDHATVAQKWAKQYGPVFQTRLGNKVRRSTLKYTAGSVLRFLSAHRLRQHIRVR